MKDIIKELEKILAMGYDANQVFTDWLDLMLYTFLSEEDYYLAVVKRYRNNGKMGFREIDYFKNACHLLMDKMRESNDDLLGEIYMQWNLSNKYTGQFFTPKNIAGLMAQISNPSEQEIISDPCCGSGIMLIESCKIMSYQALNKALFIGQDINQTCVKMCALNLLFFNLNGYVILGNTLTFECLKVYQAIRSYLGGSIRVLSEEEVEEIRPKLSVHTKQQQVNQISLF